jgi:hypothetical protein
VVPVLVLVLVRREAVGTAEVDQQLHRPLLVTVLCQHVQQALEVEEVEVPVLDCLPGRVEPPRPPPELPDDLDAFQLRVHLRCRARLHRCRNLGQLLAFQHGGGEQQLEDLLLHSLVDNVHWLTHDRVYDVEAREVHDGGPLLDAFRGLAEDVALEALELRQNRLDHCLRAEILGAVLRGPGPEPLRLLFPLEPGNRDLWEPAQVAGIARVVAEEATPLGAGRRVRDDPLHLEPVVAAKNGQFNTLEL